MSYPNDNLSDDIDALISGADALSAAADSIATITSGSDVVVSNFDHVEEVFDNLQAFLSELKSGHFYCPVGMITPFAGISAYVPAGWLMCNGSSYISSGASADLQAILNAAGFTALPDLQGKVVAGVGTILGSARTVGEGVGAETLPAHSHPINAWATTDGAGSHSHGGVTAYDADTHTHTFNATLVNIAQGSAGSTVNNVLKQGGSYATAGAQAGHRHYINGDGGHNHTIPATSTQSTGTGTHGVVQPTVVLNYIIKN